MKIVVDVKNYKGSSFSKNDLLLSDGKNWYKTTVDELFKELSKKTDEKMVEFCKKIDDMILDNAEFKKDFYERMDKLIPILGSILEEKK